MRRLALRAQQMRRALPLGPLGHLACLVFSLATAVLAREWRVAIATSLALLLAATFCRGGLRSLRNWRLWLFLAFLFLPTALWMGPADWTLLGVALSRQGLETGAQLALRALAIVIAVAGFSASVSVGELAALLERVGLRGLGFALGIAVNVLPVVQETAATAYQSLRMRGGFRRRWLRAFRLLLITTVANSLRHADDIVSAAESRAFSPQRARRQAVPWRWGDLALASLLLAVALATTLA